MAANPYPRISAKVWTTLRARAAVAPSMKFTAPAVAALMEMASPESARDNAISPMRRFGLIDEDGALTERGNLWRVDESYGVACQEILDEIYPDELGTLIDDDGHPDTAKVKTWFEHKGFGTANARQMMTTYVRIASQQIPELPAADSGRANTASPAKDAPTRSPRPKIVEVSREAVAHETPTPPVKSNTGPTVHLDIQIHIPADATPEQIEQIFSSMARHLYAK